MKSRWAVELEGHHTTIERLEASLAGSLARPTDTFIGRLRELPVLRSKLWDGINDAILVQQLAQTELSILEGLLKLGGGASPLTVGTVFELDDDDAILEQTRDSLNAVNVLAATSDAATVFRQRLDVVRKSDALSGAVVELSGSVDWIKVYKAIEYLKECYGGERQLFAAFPSKKTALQRIKRTSQSVRHRARAFQRIANPYKLEDAEKFLQSLLKDIIASISSTSPASNAGAFEIVNRDYPPQQQVGLKPLILVNGEVSNVAIVGDTLTVVESPKC